MNLKIARVALVMAATVAAGCAGRFASDPCVSLENLQLENARVVSANNIIGGKEFSLIGTVIGVPFSEMPASCRVSLEITPTPDSMIKAELWLPRDGWNGKFQGTGNGGLAGSIDHLSLSYALKSGYAVASTDTGHEASGADGRWASNHPEKIRDYGNRAVHETAVLSKKLIKAYYGVGPKYSYFGSCSNGGRQALMEAQRYPEDYDGIVAGAPFLSPTRQVPMMAWIQKQLSQPGAYISQEKLPAIAAATVKACDALDGVSDGVINDPRVCNFDPKVLLCPDKESDECLTAPQVKALKAIFSGPGPDGRAVEPGGELGIGSWSSWITGNEPGQSLHYKFASEFFRYLVYSDPTWSIDKFNLKLDGPAIYKALHKALNADNPDLSRFAARGGKLIMFHGWNDPALPPTLSVEYYNNVRKRMGAEATDKFMRLYMVPGLQHCIGGPGANIFGQFLLGNPDPTVNINATVQAWREKGREPEAIIATRYDKQLTALFAPEKAKALRTRPLCPYPKIAVWDGKGNSDNAANFNCKVPLGAFPQ